VLLPVTFVLLPVTFVLLPVTFVLLFEEVRAAVLSTVSYHLCRAIFPS